MTKFNFRFFFFTKTMVKIVNAELGLGSRGIFPPKPHVVSDLDIYPSKTTTMSEVET
jgi:hypothetical protein